MKKIVASLVVIALVAISMGVAVYAFVYSSTPEQELNSLSFSNEMGGSHNTPEEYVLNTTLPSVPEKLMAYKVVINVTEAEVAALAEQFGLTGDIRDVEGMFLVTDGHHALDVLNISGRVGYRNTSKSPSWVVESEIDRPEGAPTNEEAIEIATTFLNEKDLMPEDAVLRKVVPLTGLVYSTQTGEIVEVFWEGVKVSFRREINGYPATGCGAKMSVAMDGYGDVIELWKKWRECEPYKEYSIITPEEAFEEMKKEGVNVGLRNVSTATINSAWLAYYSKCALDEQTYLKPVYVFEGEAEGKRAEYNETGIVQYRNETAHFKQFIAAVPGLEEI